ncbi:MAG: tol-pal system-associated acyl-CoA thioesterase [Parvularculaceae bacterium]
MPATTTLSIRVYYEDTDFSAVVYHANYLRFFERGRTESLRQIAGLNHADLLKSDDPTAFTARRISVEFIQPARIDDLLEVRTTPTKAKGARLHFHQEIWRDETCLATAEVEIAAVTAMGKPTRLPPAIIKALG